MRTAEVQGLASENSVNNSTQHLYEKLGWKKDTEPFLYFWTTTQL